MPQTARRPGGQATPVTHLEEAHLRHIDVSALFGVIADERMAQQDSRRRETAALQQLLATTHEVDDLVLRGLRSMGVVHGEERVA